MLAVPVGLWIPFTLFVPFASLGGLRSNGLLATEDPRTGQHLRAHLSTIYLVVSKNFDLATLKCSTAVRPMAEVAPDEAFS